MTREKKNIAQEGNRWLRVGVLTLTMAAPIVNTIMERLRQRSQLLQVQAEEVLEKGQSAQATVLDRMDEFTLASRRRVAEQAQQLQKQAQQWQAQAQQLRKALRNEARRRYELNKAIKQLRKAGVDRSQDLLKRGEGLTEDLVARGSKISHDLVERGGRVARDLTKRGGELRHDVAERGGELTHDLARRSEQVRHDVVKRGSAFGHEMDERRKHLLPPMRKRNSNFWLLFGFSFGLVAAAVVTYLLVRKQIVQQAVEAGEHIELPQDRDLNGRGTARPAGEIHHLNNDGTFVATLQVVDVKDVEAPADAVFVGVVSTKRYYPVETSLEAEDLVYFVSEEEAKAQGFSATA